MNYEIVNLNEMKLVGLTARTKNSDKNMMKIIGSLWEQLYKGGVYEKISDKVNSKAIGLYSDYGIDMNSEYSITVGCEISKLENIPPETVVKNIPAGKYAKFVVHGHMQKAVQEFWTQLCDMKLDRNYRCDFEEYQNGDIENAEIHVYISIN